MKTQLLMNKGKNCWGDLRWVIGGHVSKIVTLRSVEAALEIYRQLSIAVFTEHKGVLEVEADGHSFDLSVSQWQGSYTCFDQWYEEYFILVENYG